MGGSLRNPAAWNGVVGFRPSRGIVPDVDPGNGWSTLAVDGPMARNVEDLYLLTRVLAQPDWRDPMCRLTEWPSALTPPDRPLRVAFSPTLGGLPIDADIATVVADAAARLQNLGWSVELAEPDFGGVDEAFETLLSLGFAAGIGTAAGDRLDELKWTIQDEVARGRAMAPGAMPAALSRQRAFWERAVAFFDRFDLLVAPVTQCRPFPIGDEYPTTVSGVAMERYITWMRSCSRVTMLGLPAISLPCGSTPDRLPVGLQLVGGPWGDVSLLRAAHAAEPVLRP
jgi:amidase